MTTTDTSGRTTTADVADVAARVPWDTFLYPIKDDVVRKLAARMRRDGFDPMQPIERSARTGKIIDGRHREAAAQRAGVEPKYVDLDLDPVSEIDRMLAKNLDRTHLDPYEQKKVARSLTRAGLPVKRIAELVNLSQRQVRAVTENERREAKAERDEVILAAPAERSSRDVARELGVAEGTVRSVRRNGGSAENAQAAVATAAAAGARAQRKTKPSNANANGTAPNGTAPAGSDTPRERLIASAGNDREVIERLIAFADRHGRDGLHGVTLGLELAHSVTPQVGRELVADVLSMLDREEGRK